LDFPFKWPQEQVVVSPRNLLPWDQAYFEARFYEYAQKRRREDHIRRLAKDLGIEAYAGIDYVTVGYDQLVSIAARAGVFRFPAPSAWEVMRLLGAREELTADQIAEELGVEVGGALDALMEMEAIELVRASATSAAHT
jgi:hypothetical protein